VRSGVLRRRARRAPSAACEGREVAGAVAEAEVAVAAAAVVVVAAAVEEAAAAVEAEEPRRRS
jgi:hypothetical protein